MNGLLITPNYSTNYSTNLKQNNVQFKGALGEKLLKENIEKLDAATFLDAVKGTFGPKTEKVQDVIEALLGKVKTLTKESLEKENKLRSANDTIAEFPREKADAVAQRERELYDVIRSNNEKHSTEITAKNEEIKKLESYRDVVKIKSVDEIEGLNPAGVIKTIDDIISTREKAHASMDKYLFEGTGSEEAREYLGKMSELNKAREEKLFDIPEIAKKEEEAKDAHIYGLGNMPIWSALSMIREALYGSEKTSWLCSPKYQNLVKDNAMALLKPLCNPKYSNTGEKSVSIELGNILKEVIEFNANYARGLENAKKNNKGMTIIEHKVPYNIEKSYITMEPNEELIQKGFTKREVSASWVADWGRH